MRRAPNASSCCYESQTRIPPRPSSDPEQISYSRPSAGATPSSVSWRRPSSYCSAVKPGGARWVTALVRVLHFSGGRRGPSPLAGAAHCHQISCSRGVPTVHRGRTAPHGVAPQEACANGPACSTRSRTRTCDRWHRRPILQGACGWMGDSGMRVSRHWRPASPRACPYRCSESVRSRVRHIWLPPSGVPSPFGRPGINHGHHLAGEGGQVGGPPRGHEVAVDDDIRVFPQAAGGFRRPLERRRPSTRSADDLRSRPPMRGAMVRDRSPPPVSRS